MSYPQKRCAYCGEPGTSKEHYWARQSDVFLPPSAVTHTIHEKVRFPLGQRTVEAKKRPGKGRSQTLKIACVPCNTGWMREVYAAPVPALIRLAAGEWWSLSEEEKINIATWATLFTMTYEHRDRDTQATSFADRNAFMASRQPGANWNIWIAAVDLDLIDPDKAFHTGLSLSLRGTGIRCNTQSTTITFGQLLVHTFSTDFHFTFDAIGYGRRFGLQPVWPVDGSVICKPERAHNIIDVELLANALLPGSGGERFFS